MFKYSLLMIIAFSFVNCTIFFEQSRMNSYNSDKLFEYCFALDFKNAAIEKKLNCWIDWTMQSDYVPDDHKVRYAHKRIREILDGKN